MGRGKAIETVFRLDEMHEVFPCPRLNLEGIREVKCYEPDDGSAYWYVICEIDNRYRGGCPKCGSATFYSHGYTGFSRVIHDVNVGMRQVDISITLPRYICKDCGQTFMHPLESIVARRCVTTRLMEQIRCDAFKIEFSEVAKAHRISDSMVECIFDEYANDLYAVRNKVGVKAPRVLGIDEKHIVHEMRGVLIDVESGKPLDMLPDNKANTMKNAIMSLQNYEKIEVVTMDMANGYRNVVEECLPYATIVIDKFHVIKDMLDKVRTERSKITEYYRHTFKDPKSHEALLLNDLGKNTYLFKFSKKKLLESKHRTELMGDLCKTFPYFNHLRILKEKFEDIYTAADRSEAESKYKEWSELCSKADPTLFAEFHSLNRSMKYWMPYILNYFNPGCDVTNAATEGVNSLIDKINTKGSGYSFKRLRARLLLQDWATRTPTYISRRVKVVSGDDFASYFEYIGHYITPPSNEHFSNDVFIDIVTAELPDNNKYKPATVCDLSSIMLYKELAHRNKTDEEIESFYVIDDNVYAVEEDLSELKDIMFYDRHTQRKYYF